jgi:hypothetical protein
VKLFGAPAPLPDHTDRALLDSPALGLETRGTIALRGKPEPVAVFAPERVTP